jgi:hypothetical protein
MVIFFFLIFGIAWGIVIIVIGRNGGGDDENDQRKCN